MKALSVSLVLGFFLTLSQAGPLQTTTPMMTKDVEHYCPYGWSYNDHQCFMFINSNKTWIEAEQFCLFFGANLASVHSSDQNHFLQTLTIDGSSDFPLTWIGGNNAVHLTAWLWSDGSKFEYDNWARGYLLNQLNKTERCLQMNYGLLNKWINAPCNNTLPFICGKMMMMMM